MKKFKSYKARYGKERRVEFCLHDDGTLSLLDDSRRDDEGCPSWGVLEKYQVKLLIKFLSDAYRD